MTNAIQKIQNIDDLARTAKMLALSGYFKGDGNFDQQVAQMATRIMAGQEIGFGPFASVNNIHVIQGKPVIGANLMASAVKSNPKYDYRVTELTNDKCIIVYYQDGDKVGESTFTMDDAKAAGLPGKDNWKKYPRNMLFARAMSNGVRLYCPDVFSGNAVYTPDELDADWHVVDEPVLDEPAQPTMHPEVEMRDEPEPTPEPEAASDGITNDQNKRLHALGNKIYGDGWTIKRRQLVEAVTKGEATSATQLTQAQAQMLIDGLEKKTAEQETLL